MARRLTHVPAERKDGMPFVPPPQMTAAFAAPPLSEGAPYVPNTGWAPPAYRDPRNPMGAVDMRPNPGQAPQEHWRRIDADDARRHSVEYQDADGWQEQKGGSGPRIAPDPRRTPPPESRPTQQMAPTTYQFTRPFDQLNRVYPEGSVGSARQLNGIHFSMADHRRTYEILGMAPPRRARNTYRLMPAPWDTNIVDLPPETELPNARVRSVEVPYQTRSYRL